MARKPTTPRSPSRSSAPPTPASAARYRTPAILVGLCALTLAAYSNSFTTGFALDSKQLVLQDPRVHAATASNLDLILEHSYWWPYGESGLYRPATTLTYLFNYAVLGNRDRPAGYHWFNVALHACNVLLVYVLIRRLTRDWWTSFAAAAVWSVVPLSTEAVTNIVGRADLLAALAVLGGLLLYLNSRDASGSRRVGWLTGLAAITAIGVFSKESAVVIAPAIALYELAWWRRGRSGAALRGAGLALAPPLVLMWLQRSAVLGGSPAAEFAFVDNPIVGAGFWMGRLTAVTVMARYLCLLVWPATLSSDYSYAQIPIASGTIHDWMACLAVAALAATAISLARRQRTVFFFAAFAFVTFLPASNLLFPTGTTMAERLMYLPSVGLVAAFVIAMFAAGRRFGAPWVPAVAMALVVLGFAARTWSRNPDWQNDLTLWTSAVHAAPSSAKAHRALAEALYDADPTNANIDRVIVEAERSVALLEPLPDDLGSFQEYRQAAGYYLDKANQSRRLSEKGDLAASNDARRAYERALALLQRCLAIIAADSARQPRVSRDPEAHAYRLLAAVHLGLDDPGQSLEAASRARSLGPSHPLAYRLEAGALLASHRPDEAVVALMVGSVVTGDTALGQEIIDLYRSGLDEHGCAVTTRANGPVLNPACPVVRRHLCIASTESVGLNLQLGRRDRAEHVKAVAVNELKCPPEPLERLLPSGR